MPSDSLGLGPTGRAFYGMIVKREKSCVDGDGSVAKVSNQIDKI